MTKLIATTMFLCLAAPPCLAVDRSHPDSPDFDPVARMKRFDPDWEPPKVSAEEIAKHPLGSQENPVRSQGPTGQRNYLAHLECPDGTSPRFNRLGSLADGVYGFPMDKFEVFCGERRSLIFMDLYHPLHVESSAVPGFGRKLLPGSK